MIAANPIEIDIAAAVFPNSTIVNSTVASHGFPATASRVDFDSFSNTDAGNGPAMNPARNAAKINAMKACNLSFVIATITNATQATNTTKGHRLAVVSAAENRTLITG
jgi:hypothetical protein